MIERDKVGWLVIGGGSALAALVLYVLAFLVVRASHAASVTVDTEAWTYLDSASTVDRVLCVAFKPAYSVDARLTGRITVLQVDGSMIIIGR